MFEFEKTGKQNERNKKLGRPLKGKDIINFILDKIKNTRMKTNKRPEDIPPIVPDCGWNHGEITGESKKNKAAL